MCLSLVRITRCTLCLSVCIHTAVVIGKSIIVLPYIYNMPMSLLRTHATLDNPFPYPAFPSLHVAAFSTCLRTKPSWSRLLTRHACDGDGQSTEKVLGVDLEVDLEVQEPTFWLAVGWPGIALYALTLGIAAVHVYIAALYSGFFRDMHQESPWIFLLLASLP